MQVRRVVALLLSVLALLMLAAVPARATPPNSPPSLDGQKLPAGFPANLRRFVAGTPQFKSAVWSTACKPGGVSAQPNTDPRLGWLNEAAVPGGIDVGRYLEAAEPHLPLLAWWAQTRDDRIKWWQQHFAGAYPSDAATASKSPPIDMLPKWPSEVSGYHTQYHWGFCSAELAKWAEPADTQIGFNWSQQLDQVTLDDAKHRKMSLSQVEKTPCDQNIDGGVWCSIAYYVDCTKTETRVETQACLTWNDDISEEIYEDYHWIPDHESNWDKIKSFFVGLVLGSVGAAADVANFFVGIYHGFKKIIDFIAHAASAFDKLVNELKENSIGLVTSVLHNYNRGSAWNPSEGGFLSRYALMAGLGIILAAFMFFGAIRRAMDSGKREESRDLWIRLAKTFAIIIWAPALFQLLATNGTEATADIVERWTGGQAGGAVHKLTGMSNVTDSIPGGAFMGFILFLFLFIGALGLWVGLIVQRYGMEVGATLIAFVAGAYVHPRWEKKVSRALWVVVGLILAKPLTMIVLGATFGVINEGLSFHGSSTEVLAGLTLATIGVVTTGLAPFAALRWAPVLPTSSRSHDHHRGGGGAVTGAVLGAAGASMAGRAAWARRSRPAGRPPSSTGAARGVGGPLTAAYDSGSVSRKQVNGATSTSRAAVGAGRSGAASAGRRVGGLAAAGAALGAQAAQAGLHRGRALADHQTPDLDLPDEGGR